MPDYSDTRIQLRRGSAAEWASANTVLGEGEPGFSVNNNTLKIGDGVTTYANLSGISGGGGGGGISNVVEDTTPQLGGALDAQNNNITSVGILGVGGGATFEKGLTVNNAGAGTSSDFQVKGQSDNNLIFTDAAAVAASSAACLASATVVPLEPATVRLSSLPVAQDS